MRTSDFAFTGAPAAARPKERRQIVRIDEEKCDGCGLCVPSCAEGALRIVDGKAKLVSETYCDGLGACLGECPRGAITIEEAEAEAFDEEAVERHLRTLRSGPQAGPPVPAGCPGSAVAGFGRSAAAASPAAAPGVPAGCPGAAITRFGRREAPATRAEAPLAPQPSSLGHWPVQLTLVPPGAPFLQGADLLLAADCVPFAYAGFHRDFLEGRALLVACPKLDDFPSHLAKLTAVLSRSDVRSLTVVHMEVPCCSGLVHMARHAIQLSGKDIPFREVTVGIRGGVLD